MDSKAQKCIALLRGINISGRDKVPMAELKKGFESLSFTAVRTWLNSGNVREALMKSARADSERFFTG